MAVSEYWNFNCNIHSFIFLIFRKPDIRCHSVKRANVSNEIKRHQHLLFNAQGCTVWILCQFWCFQVNTYIYILFTESYNQFRNYKLFTIFLFSYELLTTCFYEFPKFQTYWTRTQFFCQIAALHSSVRSFSKLSFEIKISKCLIYHFVKPHKI